MTTPVKTPSKRRSQPLTPSMLNTNTSSHRNSVFSTKADISINPFAAPCHPHGQNLFSKSLGAATRPKGTHSHSSSHSRSRPASPVKKLTGSGSGGIQVTASLKRQASAGVIRKGGIESKLNVVKMDYVPPPKEEEKRDGRPDMRRSRSTPGSGRDRSVGDKADRFITKRETDDATAELAATLGQLSLGAGRDASPGHTARLVAATGVPIGKRVLAYHEPPPAPSRDTSLAPSRAAAKPLYARPGTLASSIGAVTSKVRKISPHPVKVLDAPNLVDDYYLNLIDWSVLNVVAVALGSSVYVYNADTGVVTPLGEAPDEGYISSVRFSQDGAFLAVGMGTGEVELWDIEATQKLRTMSGHQAQVACMAWDEHIVSSGCGDGSIWHHDVRAARHKSGEALGHQGEVCGLEYQPGVRGLLASGGNDNVVNIWDGRTGDTVDEWSEEPKWTKRNHTAAVKALAWCPWQPSLLASGGGTNDACIHIWNSTTGARLHTLRTPAQVTSVEWAPHKKELFSTHGYPTNALMVHAYPSLETVAEIRDAHDARVLFSAVGPAGDVVLTGASDENLKFWKIWEVEKKKKKEVKEAGGSGRDGRGGIHSIR